MPKKAWQKNLYENQEYEDNYTDPSFLKDLKKNYNLKEYKLIDCINGITIVNQEISIVTLFLIIFYYLYQNTVQPQKLLFSSFALTSTGYLIYIALDFGKINNVIEDSKTVVVVLAYGPYQ